MRAVTEQNAGWPRPPEGASTAASRATAISSFRWRRRNWVIFHWHTRAHARARAHRLFVRSLFALTLSFSCLQSSGERKREKPVRYH